MKFSEFKKVEKVSEQFCGFLISIYLKNIFVGYRSAIFNAIAAVFPASTLKEIVEYNTFPLLQIVRGERGRNQPRNRVQNARYMGAALCLKAVPGGIIPDMVFAMFEELSGGVLTSEAWRFCTNAEIQRGADRHGVRLAHYDEL